MATSRLTDALGRVLGGRYRLIAPLGVGASAQVFLADDVRLRRRVAVKMLHLALADDHDFLRRFQAEAQAAAALNHPHVMAVYDWGQDDVPYLVLEFLGGGSLRGMLDKGRRLSPSQALRVGLEAGRALEYAHNRGLVHRDIKPANLLFGDEGRLRIADFGLARALAEAAWTEPHGAVLGTARYAAPEQARGERLDGRADVYALTLVLIEAVTGRVPFSADTTIGTLMGRVNRSIDVPVELGALRSVLERAGTADPTKRLDAHGFVTALLAAARELPVPKPLPLAGTAADDPDIPLIDADPTAIPGGTDEPIAANGSNGFNGSNGSNGARPPQGTRQTGDVTAAAPTSFDEPEPPASQRAPGGPGTDLGGAGLPGAAGGGLTGGSAGINGAADGAVPELAGETAADPDATVVAGPSDRAGPDTVEAEPAGADIAETEPATSIRGRLGALRARRTERRAGRREKIRPAVGGSPPASSDGADADAGAGGGDKNDTNDTDDKQPRRRSRRVKAALAVAAVLVLVGLAVAGTVVFQTVQPKPAHAVPASLSQGKLTARQAQARVKRLGYDWRIRLVHARKDGSVVGSIIGTRPPPGQKLKEGGVLTLVVSDGNTLVKVPTDLVGKTLEAAQAELNPLLLQAEPQYTYDEKVDKGLIMKVADGTPAELVKGAKFAVVVSNGPAPRTIPSGLAGSTPSAVTSQLQGMGLVVQESSDYSAKVPKGQVIGTSPGAGAQVPRGSTVNVIVSKGPPPVPVPSIAGAESLQDAIDRLDAAGLVPGLAKGPLTGKPTAYSPGSGTEVQRGSSVDIVLG